MKRLIAFCCSAINFCTFNLCSILAEEVDTIENYVEPFLVRSGFLQRTTRGRVITERGKKHLLESKNFF